MSLLELRAEMDRLKSSEHYARYLETEFDEAARDDVVRSFAQRFSSIEHLVQQQELLKVQASVQAGAAPSRMMETAEQRRVCTAGVLLLDFQARIRARKGGEGQKLDRTSQAEPRCWRGLNDGEGAGARRGFTRHGGAGCARAGRLSEGH